MKTMSAQALKAMKQVLTREVTRNNQKWPPCTGILHQPKRPEKESIEENK